MFECDYLQLMRDLPPKAKKRLRDVVIFQNSSKTLNPNRLTPDSTSSDRQEILARAGRAAAQMPNLETMHLWNTSDGFLYIMAYRHCAREFGGEPLLLLRSSVSAMHQDFSPYVVSIWRRVPKCAREPSLKDLRVKVTRLYRETINTRIEVLYPANVMHHVTLHQLKAERETDDETMTLVRREDEKTGPVGRSYIEETVCRSMAMPATGLQKDRPVGVTAKASSA